MREQEYLQQLQIINEEIEDLQETIRELDDQSQKAVSLLNQLRVSGTLDLRRFEKACVEKQDMIDELSAKILEQTILYQDILSSINKLSNQKHRKVLTYRYVDGLDWKEIMSRMKLRESRIFELHADALCSIVVPIQYAEKLDKHVG